MTRGNPVPVSQVIQPPTAGLAAPNLIDLVTLLPPEQQQSYVEDGDAQVLDHVLITQDLLAMWDRLAYAHIDADFPLVDKNDANLPARISDHDPALAYFTLPAVAGGVTLTTTVSVTKTKLGFQERIAVTNKGTGVAPRVTLTSATLGTAMARSLPAGLGDIAPGATAMGQLEVPVSAGPDGAVIAERLTGTYIGGSFGNSQRITLP